MGFGVPESVISCMHSTVTSPPDTISRATHVLLAEKFISNWRAWKGFAIFYRTNVFSFGERRNGVASDAGNSQQR